MESDGVKPNPPKNLIKESLKKKLKSHKNAT